MFLFHWVIFRFHPLIFRGVTHPILGFTKNQWLEDEFPFGVPAYFRSDVGFREGTSKNDPTSNMTSHFSIICPPQKTTQLPSSGFQAFPAPNKKNTWNWHHQPWTCGGPCGPHPQKTNSSHLKIDPWKKEKPIGNPSFSGDYGSMLCHVSFREGLGV